MCEIIQWVIQSDLAAVWDEIAEFILEGKLILTNPGGTVSVCGGSGITISAGIVGRSEHTIVKQSKPGGKRTIKSCFLFGRSEESRIFRLCTGVRTDRKTEGSVTSARWCIRVVQSSSDM